jgi:hypothetical protein
MHGISGVLAGELWWRGPDGWTHFLSQQRDHIARRNLRIFELLATVGEHFRRQGIPIQALKGARHCISVSSPEAAPGLSTYHCRAALMAHMLLHAAGGMAYRTLRLMQLHDVTLLMRRMTPSDWQQPLEWQPLWAWPPLMLAARYYGRSAAERVRDALRNFCPAILRRTCARQLLSDVSQSRLWLEAFPGLEWSHSPREAATYIARRIVPSSQVLRIGSMD